MANKVVIEGQDAETLALGEETTLARWGNIIIKEIKKVGGIVVVVVVVAVVVVVGGWGSTPS